MLEITLTHHKSFERVIIETFTTGRAAGSFDVLGGLFVNFSATDYAYTRA